MTRTPFTLSLLLVLTSACGGTTDAVGSTATPDPLAATPESTSAEPTPAESTSTEPTLAGTNATPVDESTQHAVDGCASETTITATRVSQDFDPVELVPPGTPITGGHFVLDLDGFGFGPLMSGRLTTDPSLDLESLDGDAPPSPTAGQAHIAIGLEGPPVGATEYPLGAYGVTFDDDTFSPTEGMGLTQLEIATSEGNFTTRRDNEVEITHIGDGMLCGTIRSTGREPGPSNPVTNVEGSFVATYSEQP